MKTWNVWGLQITNEVTTGVIYHFILTAAAFLACTGLLLYGQARFMHAITEIRVSVAAAKEIQEIFRIANTNQLTDLNEKTEQALRVNKEHLQVSKEMLQTLRAPKRGQR